MKLILGLGNPGRQYEHTRHNVGFEVVDELARRHTVEFRRSWRHPAAIARAATEEGLPLLLVKPRTYMNLSGTVLPGLFRRHGLAAADLIVVVDDVDLPPGKMRIRARGSPGGHNGLKSIVQSLGTEEFTRVRVGVGRNPAAGDMVRHVLGRLGKAERLLVDEVVPKAVDAVLMIMRDGVDKAMNVFN